MKHPILILLLSVFTFQSNATSIIASSLGFNPTDATSSLQGAIDSGNDTVIIDLQASDWITQPLFIDSISNLVVILEPGVQVVAKSGAFLGLNDRLLQISSSDHIAIFGYGAVLRMIKSEYTTGEWRHCLAIVNSSFVSVAGLELNDSGGDGLYLADLGTNNYCRNIHIKDCKMDNNKRQGVSIVSADSVLIEHCEMTNTNGTSPEAGMDLEPDLPAQRITNILVRKCRFTGNNGSGVMVNSKYLDGTSVPIAVLIEDCYLASNRESQLYLNSDTVEASGNVTVNRTFIEISAFPGVYVEKSATDFFLTMNDCVLKNVGDTSFTFYSPITFQTFASLQNTSEYGGAAFNNCLIEFSKNRAYMQCVDLGLPPGSADISGNFTIVNPNSVAPAFGSSPSNINVTQRFFTSFPPQLLSMQTSDADAFEGASDLAGFEISRAAADSFPLAVNYSIAGTAGNRTDYSLLPGFLIIPSLTAAASDSLSAIADLVTEITEEVLLQISASSSYSISSQDSVLLFIDPVPNGIAGQDEMTISAYPNPNQGLFELHYSEAFQQGTMDLTDVTGKVIFSTALTPQSRETKVDIRTLAPGIYFCRITNENNVSCVKIIRE